MMKGQTKQGTLEMKYNFAMKAHIPKVPVTKTTNWLSSSWRPEQTEYQKLMMDMDESGIGLEKSRRLAVFYRLQAEAMAVDLNKQEEKQNALDDILDAASDEIQSTRATMHEQGLFYNGEVESHQKTRETHWREVEKWQLQLSIFTAGCIQTLQNQENVIKELVSTQRHLETVYMPMQITDIRKEEHTRTKAQQKMVGKLTRKLKKVRRQCLSQSKTLTARKRQGLKKNAQLKALELQVRALEKVRVKEALEEENESSTHCLICGEAAQGKSYGVRTCLACRVFFMDHAVSKRYKTMSCPKRGSCRTIGKSWRAKCSHCRLQKCFDVGMTAKAGDLEGGGGGKGKVKDQEEENRPGLLSSPLAARSGTTEEVADQWKEEDVEEVSRPRLFQGKARGMGGIKRYGAPSFGQSSHKKVRVSPKEGPAAWLHNLFGRHDKTA